MLTFESSHKNAHYNIFQPVAFMCDGVPVLMDNGLVLDGCISFASALFWCYLSFIALSQGWSCVTLPIVSWLPWSAASSPCSQSCCCRASLLCAAIGLFSRLWLLCLCSCCSPIGGESVCGCVGGHTKCVFGEALRAVYYFTVVLSVPVSHCDIVWYVWPVWSCSCFKLTPSNSHTWIHM